MITNATATDTNNRNHQVKWIPTSQSALSWAVWTKLEHKVCKKRPEFPWNSSLCSQYHTFPPLFLDPFPNYSCILSTMCETLLSNLQYLKLRTSSWPYISVWANFRNYALCCSTDVHFLFVHRLQVAKEEIYIVWLYIGKIDKNKVFARQYCQETCYRSWVAIATWAAR